MATAAEKTLAARMGPKPPPAWAQQEVNEREAQLRRRKLRKQYGRVGARIRYGQDYGA